MLPENRRPRERAPGVHDAVGAGLLQAPHPVFGGEEVARGEDRNAEPALGFGYGLPVRPSTKALLGRARMERHEACAGVLEAQGKVEPVDGIAADPEPELEAHVPGQGRGNHGSGAGQGVVRIAQHGRARALPCYLGHRAAHVEVEPGKALFPQAPDGPAKAVCLGAEELDDQGRVPGHGLKHLPGVEPVVPEPLGAHHLRDAARRSLLAAERAEGEIAVACQRRKPGLVPANRQPFRLLGRRLHPRPRRLHTDPCLLHAFFRRRPSVPFPDRPAPRTVAVKLASA